MGEQQGCAQCMKFEGPLQHHESAKEADQHLLHGICVLLLTLPFEAWTKFLHHTQMPEYSAPNVWGLEHLMRAGR